VTAAFTLEWVANTRVSDDRLGGRVAERNILLGVSDQGVSVVRIRTERILLNLPASVAIPVGASILGVIGAHSEGITQISFFAGSTVFIGLGALSGWLKQAHKGWRQAYEDVAARMARTFSGGALPVILDLGRVCKSDPPTAEAPVRALREQVLNTMRNSFGHVDDRTGVHAAYYALNADGHLRLEGNPLWGGSSPREVIGAEADDADLVQLVQTPLRARRSDDVTADDFGLDILETGMPDYRSCVVASVGIGRGHDSLKYGLLVITAAETGAFEQSDQEGLRLLSGIFAAALAHADKS
jgi:hypothetical protein